MTSQLRVYTINRGMMDQWVKLFTESLVPMQEKHGVKIEGMWVSEDSTQFICIRSFADSEDVKAKQREAKAGDFLHVSKGAPHSFINRSQTPAKIIATFVPAGKAEQFFRDALEETTDRNATPPSLDDAMIQRMMAAAERNGVEILPPPEG